MDAITLNVSGRRFEISPDTFLRLSQAMPAKIQSCPRNYVNGRQEYFFERHADIFQNILLYYQTGVLHMPQCVCPCQFKMELEFWEVDHSYLSKCCYNRYVLAMDNQGKLREFENYFKAGSYFQSCTSKWQRIRQFGWELMNDPFSSFAAEIYFWVSTLLVILNTTLICVSTHEYFRGNFSLTDFPVWLQDYFIRHYSEGIYQAANLSNVTYSQFIAASELITVPFSYPFIFVVQIGLFGCFAIEFLFLLLFCPSFKAFIASPLHVVDLLAILPFAAWFVLDAVAPYGPYINKAESILSGLSILRVFRLLRLARRIKGLRIILFSVKSSLEDVFLLALMLCMSTVIFACIMYYVDDRATFPSIVDGFWWVIVTMTTVGYGDQVPRTLPGKLLGSLCAVSGVIIVALTVPVFVSKFQLYYTNTEVPQASKTAVKRRVFFKRGEKTSQVHPK